MAQTTARRVRRLKPDPDMPPPEGVSEQKPPEPQPEPVPKGPDQPSGLVADLEAKLVRYEDMKALVTRCWQDLKYVKSLWGNTYIERAEREVADRMKDLGIIT